jgi:transcriptional regulator with XRE-family HTH domain
MHAEEKQALKRRLGRAITKLIAQKRTGSNGETIDSLRQLAKSSGVQYYAVQKISAGKKDPQFTTLAAIAAGLDMPLSKLISLYEKTDADL